MEVAVAADDGFGSFSRGERDEVVVVRVSGHSRWVRRIWGDVGDVPEFVVQRQRLLGGDEASELGAQEDVRQLVEEVLADQNLNLASPDGGQDLPWRPSG